MMFKAGLRKEEDDIQPKKRNIMQNTKLRSTTLIINRLWGIHLLHTTLQSMNKDAENICGGAGNGVPLPHWGSEMLTAGNDADCFVGVARRVTCRLNRSLYCQMSSLVFSVRNHSL
jgi:hypothetical protein